VLDPKDIIVRGEKKGDRLGTVQHQILTGRRKGAKRKNPF